MTSILPKATKILSFLQSDASIETIYPLLREIKPIQDNFYKNHPGPKIVLEMDGWGDWNLWTTVPGADYTHQATWSTSEGLSPEDESELRSHLKTIVQMWIDQDALFSHPMSKKDVADLLDIEVKTLNRHIKSGIVTAIEMNKNMIRVLQSDLDKNNS